MKIFIPFQLKSVGGPSSFVLKFQAGMQARGHEVFFEYRPDYDILFLIVQAPFKYLFDAKKKKKPIVQRLDGVWYYSVVGWKFPLYNLKAILIRHFFSDFSVYQSEYSKYCVGRFLGKKSPDPSAIIYNGIDLERFNPAGPKIEGLRDNKEQELFFTVSDFRREDQILPIFQALARYRKAYGTNFKFLIAGVFSGKIAHIPKKYQHFKEIVFLGKINNVDLPLYERAADVFLFTHLNPPCPNNIIEALACGLPVCGVADGAMPELITHGESGLLSAARGQAFWKKRSFDPKVFSDNLAYTMTKKRAFAQASRQTAEKNFSLTQMIDQYLSVFESLGHK